MPIGGSSLKRRIRIGLQITRSSKQNRPPQSLNRWFPCSYCDLHLPQNDALAQDGRYYCCAEHRDSISQKGWWGKAQWRASTNFDERPEGIAVDLAVIHHISLPPGQFGGTILLISFKIIWILRHTPILSKLPIKRYQVIS